MFERKPLRADVAAEILGRIIDGRIPSGTRINESQLSAELGISRTPLREAMLCLTTEGALASDMGRGFRVPHLASSEATDLLATLAVTLEAAVRRSPRPDMKGLLEIGNLLGRARMHATAPAAFCEQFYLVLVQMTDACPNQVLREECVRVGRLSLRYLFEGLSRGLDPIPLLDRLEAALEDLDRGQTATAAEALAGALDGLARDLAIRFPAKVASHA